jgi:hypothetical protein
LRSQDRGRLAVLAKEQDNIPAVGLPSIERNILSKITPHIANEMAGIDIAILLPHTEGDQIANRPMSNDGDVPAALDE